MSEQQTTKKVLYKGIMVPARELKVGKGKVKLVPIKPWLVYVSVIIKLTKVKGVVT